MAVLFEDKDRESWLTWAIELMRRGLSPTGGIEVHGPHDGPANCMWGDAECEDINGEDWIVRFQTVHGVRNIWDVRNVRVWPDERQCVPNTFPLVPVKQLPAAWRERMTQMKKERDQLRSEAIEARRVRRALWKQWQGELRHKHRTETDPAHAGKHVAKLGTSPNFQGGKNG